MILSISKFNLNEMFFDLPPVDSNSTTFVRDTPQKTYHTFMPALIEEYPFKREKYELDIPEFKKTYTQFEFIRNTAVVSKALLVEHDLGSMDVLVPLLIKRKFKTKVRLSKVSKFIPTPNIE